MEQYSGVVTPRIIRPASGTTRAVVVLGILLALATAIIGVFSIGKRVGVKMLEPLVEYMHTAEGECNALPDQISGLKQQNTILTRSQQINREVSLNLSQQLKDAQDKRLALEKEVSLLRRLVQEGSRGILQLKDFKIEALDTLGEFRYGFTVRQLVPDFVESTGKIEVRVIGKLSGETKDRSLAKLAGYNRLRHKMKFKHFQNVQGSIKVPDDFKPERVVVEVKPANNKITPVSETFPWSIE